MHIGKQKGDYIRIYP